MDYLVTAIAMRAARLFAFLLCMGIMHWWGASALRWLGRRLLPSLVSPVASLAAFVPIDVANPASIVRERERGRAIFVLLALAVFLIQARWLTPGLPEIWTMRLWLSGIALVDLVLVAGIFHIGRSDPRFDSRRAVWVWGAVFAISVLFAVVSA